MESFMVMPLLLLLAVFPTPWTTGAPTCTFEYTPPSSLSHCCVHSRDSSSSRRPKFDCLASPSLPGFRVFHEEDESFGSWIFGPHERMKSWEILPWTANPSRAKRTDFVGFESFFVKFSKENEEFRSYFAGNGKNLVGVSNGMYAMKLEAEEEEEKKDVYYWFAEDDGIDNVFLKCAVSAGSCEWDDMRFENNKFYYDDEFSSGFDKMVIERVNELRVTTEIHPVFKLASGLVVPLLGYGTGGLNGEQTKQGVKAAVDAGYALVDSASVYHNEEQVRDSVFVEHKRRPIVITKVWPTELGFGRTHASVEQSAVKLGGWPLDSVLLHWPRCYAEWKVDWMDCSKADPDPEGMLWLESWSALEKLYAEGLILSIGVSNFEKGLLEILEKQALVFPMIVQNYMSVDFHDKEVFDICTKHGSLYQAYSMFRTPFDKVQAKLIDRAMLESGVKHNNIDKQHTYREFVLKAALSSGVGVLMRSRGQHIRQNIQAARFGSNSFDFFTLFAENDEEDEQPSCKI